MDWIDLVSKCECRREGELLVVKGKLFKRCEFSLG